ncbi:MAG: peptide deformylase [Verrucomicrobiales bacterium]|nr:peptide deformylase [Verrucomicrobiales bacterium]MDB6129767.1 peptide deformylase [Verrucomicrobiales bacterium]
MVLPVVKYGDPILRKKGATVPAITPEIKKLVKDMLETMYDAHGVGLAAQQVGKALQVTVIDVSGVTDRPSTMEIGGKEVDVKNHMPVTLINPEVKATGKPVAGPEGCLSFPEIYADISRSETVDVKALDENGEVVQFSCGGLLARAVQHEVDHLNAILFIDRMTKVDKLELKEQLEEIRNSKGED